MLDRAVYIRKTKTKLRGLKGVSVSRGCGQVGRNPTLCRCGLLDPPNVKSYGFELATPKCRCSSYRFELSQATLN